MIGIVILLAFERYQVPSTCRTIAEKTPGNVFLFPRPQALLPRARFIAIARDLRDVLSSAWHFFAEPQRQPLEAFIAAALPSIEAGMREMLDFGRANQRACQIVTYESLQLDTARSLAELFALHGVKTDTAVIDLIVRTTDFSAATHGRQAGTVLEGSFHRAGW